MRKIREVLRLKFEAGLSDRQIAAALGSARSTVQECLRRCREAEIGWPLPPQIDEATLLARLYRRITPLSIVALPDFAAVHRELARAGVTRRLLWEEYKSAQPEGLQYTAFCVHYQRWLATQELVFRQVHAPGEKLFVDYAGHTVPILDRHTGETRAAQIFVAVLGASNYTYAEATSTQSLPDWLGSHVRALERLNTRAFKKLDGCRRSRFEAIERPALRPLPARGYEFAEWRVAKVHPDYHIEVARAYYSVPYRLIGQRVDVRLTARAVEIFHQHALIASHPRARERSALHAPSASPGEARGRHRAEPHARARTGGRDRPCHP